MKSEWAETKEIYLRQKCLLTAWVSAVLREGFHLVGEGSNSTVITSEDIINGKDAKWTLGALVTRYSNAHSSTSNMSPFNFTPL